VNTDIRPKVLLVYFTLSKQTGRVAEVMAQALETRGCDVTKALIEFTDDRWVPKLSQFPMKHPIPQIASILPAQLRHKTGEIRVPPEAQTGNYDLVVLASPTWWFQTSMPIRSYLESPDAKTVLNGKPFACASVSRRYFSINLGQQKKLGEKNRGALDRQDTLRRRGRSGHVDALVARIHEARRTAGARLRLEDAASEPPARLRGAGAELRRRRAGSRRRSAVRRRREGLMSGRARAITAASSCRSASNGFVQIG
jgi:menaquinone-dependent protoporphyrinogen IX oxidase